MIFKTTLRKLQFDKQLWLQNREQRIYMITSLMDCKLLNGLTKKEVLKTLGFEFNDINSDTWSYYIGTRRRIFRVKCFLFIYFDGLGRVYKVLKK